MRVLPRPAVIHCIDTRVLALVDHERASERRIRCRIGILPQHRTTHNHNTNNNHHHIKCLIIYLPYRSICTLQISIYDSMFVTHFVRVLPYILQNFHTFHIEIRKKKTKRERERERLILPLAVVERTINNTCHTSPPFPSIQPTIYLSIHGV